MVVFGLEQIGDVGTPAIDDVQIVYQKPYVGERSEMTFPREIIEKFNNGRYCIQCSGCHGCR